MNRTQNTRNVSSAALLATRRIQRSKSARKMGDGQPANVCSLYKIINNTVFSRGVLRARSKRKIAGAKQIQSMVAKRNSSAECKMHDKDDLSRPGWQ